MGINAIAKTRVVACVIKNAHTHCTRLVVFVSRVVSFVNVYYYTPWCEWLFSLEQHGMTG